MYPPNTGAEATKYAVGVAPQGLLGDRKNQPLTPYQTNGIRNQEYPGLNKKKPA